MLTHRLYIISNNIKKYFCGIFEDRADSEGIYGYIVWDWNRCIEQSTMLTSPDAWNLLGAARKQYPNHIIEVERAYTLGDIQRIMNR